MFSDAEIITNLGDFDWRIRNLYHIVDKNGQRVLFVPNAVQEDFYSKMNEHPRIVVLKSRQHGLSTACLMRGLDRALFGGLDVGKTHNDFAYAVTAQTMDDAKKLLATKIAYPYNSLPDMIKKLVPLADNAKKCGTERIKFANGAEIYADVTVRSGTVQSLHSSELAKTAKESPEKAKEVVEGAFNAVTAGGTIIIESTAEGPSGQFYDICDRAMTLSSSNAPLTSLDFKFVFYSWFMDKTNVLSESDAEIVDITNKHEDYFQEIENYWKRTDPEVGEKYFPLNLRQKAWYIKKSEEQGDGMLKEHPSTPEESFQQSVKGAWFSNQFRKIDKEGRITKVPYTKGVPVHTAWDLGFNDDTCIWFYQNGPAGQIHVIDYFMDHEQNVEYYIEELRKKPYHYGYHFGPHDLRQKNMATGKSTYEIARGFGFQFVILPQIRKIDQIQNARRIMENVWIDKTNCAVDNPMADGNYKYSGVSRLRNYSKRWSEAQGMFLDDPLHDHNSHAADSWLYMCQSVGTSFRKPQAKKVEKNWRIR